MSGRWRQITWEWQSISWWDFFLCHVSFFQSFHLFFSWDIFKKLLFIRDFKRGRKYIQYWGFLKVPSSHKFYYTFKLTVGSLLSYFERSFMSPISKLFEFCYLIYFYVTKNALKVILVFYDFCQHSRFQFSRTKVLIH